MAMHVKALLPCFLLAAGSLTAQGDHALTDNRLRHPASFLSPARATLPQSFAVSEDLAAKAAKPVASNIVKPAPGEFVSMYDHNIVVAYYGNPHSTRMGILGETPLPQATASLKKLCAEYDALNGPDEGVIPAYHLIYATIHPNANLGFLSDDKVLEFIQYGLEHGVMVVLDHQLGKYSVEESMRRMLPFLHYPNVHLAIDPEWKTPQPGKFIGAIDASDVNLAMDMMQDYLVKNNIKQRKMLMVHQFHPKMIGNRANVKAAPSRVDLIHNADGFGGVQLKLNTYRQIVAATNMPLKGFKLFLAKPWKSAGYDKPVLSPKEVLELNPRPIFLNYQ